jgi:putative flippase GtrA
VEIIARYLTGRGRREGLYELPLRRWTDVGESRVKPRDFLRAGGEMAAIYRIYRLRRDLTTLFAVLSAPFLRYVGAGGIGTAVHYVTLTLIVELFGVNPALATAFGATAGAAVNYVLNYHFTFASKVSHARTLPRFAAVAALSALMNAAGMWYAVRRLHVHYLLAQLACTLAVLLVGYALNKIWTFRSAAMVVEGAAPENARAASTEDADTPARSPLETPKS